MKGDDVDEEDEEDEVENGDDCGDAWNVDGDVIFCDSDVVSCCSTGARSNMTSVVATDSVLFFTLTIVHGSKMYS